MAIRRYLAMTAGEIRENSQNDENLAWMACHFSPYGRGLSNLPQWLEPGSLLILDDITPIHGHDPEVIGEQLRECVQALDCSGVLLDFQREGYTENGELVRYLSQVLPCPAAISALYAQRLDCPVFLPPPPCHVPLEEYLAPWAGREVWLEMALDGADLTVREDGTEITPLPWPDFDEIGFVEEKLHCHYRIQVQEAAMVFTLWRTGADLEALLKEAEALGVTTAVGLYQELGSEKLCRGRCPHRP